MSNGTQDVLDRLFASLSGGMGNIGGALASAVSGGGSNPTPGGAQSTGSKAASFGMDILKSGGGLVSLAVGLWDLFSGGDETPPPLVKYAMPSSIEFQGAESGSGIVDASYDQSGMARAVAGSKGSVPNQPSVVVNVQAMDARSFLDRSSDIAAAVRDAMLNLNSINDVVNDL